MKNKKLICNICIFVLAVSMCGCTDSDETVVQTNKKEVSTDTNVESTMENREESKENESMESENVEEVYFTESEEIKNASIKSGMIQVGNIVMKVGGYTTVGEFITRYGENLDTSFYEEKVSDYNSWWERDADEDFRHVLNLPIKDTDVTLSVSYVSPRTITPDKKTIWDSIIVDVYASSESGENCMWYPGGSPDEELNSLDEVKEWFSKNGYTENTDYDYENSDSLFFDIKNPKANLNKYTTINKSDNGYVMAVIEVDEINLFGERPIMICYVHCIDSNVSVRYGNQMYLDSKNSWKSEIR